MNFIKYKFISVGYRCYVGYGTFVKPHTTILGKSVFIGNKCHLSVKKLFIDDFAMLASNVAIVGGDHRFDVIGTPAAFTGRGKQKGVNIGKDCWIGYGVIILDGVQIGDSSVIGAGSVVTKNVEPFSLYAGVPAKKIGNRFNRYEDNEIHYNSILTYTS